MIQGMAPIRRFICVLALLCATQYGCVQTPGVRLESTQKLAVTDPSEQADRLWNAAIDTLRQRRFVLDRVDRSAGVITTLPETSQHLTEPWRKDVYTWRDLAESTLNPLRRWVEVRFAMDEGTWHAIEVIVHKERLSAPDRQFNNSGAAYAFFGYSLPSTTGLAKITPAQESWVNIGRDEHGEAHLLSAILACAGLVEPDRR